MDQLIAQLDLPGAAHTRWGTRDKQRVVQAVIGGWLGLKQTCAYYQLSLDEFLSWRRRYLRGR